MCACVATWVQFNNYKGSPATTATNPANCWYAKCCSVGT